MTKRPEYWPVIGDGIWPSGSMGLLTDKTKITRLFFLNGVTALSN